MQIQIKIILKNPKQKKKKKRKKEKIRKKTFTLRDHQQWQIAF